MRRLFPLVAGLLALSLSNANAAPRPQLVKLPGVGTGIAEKVIAGRPYQSKLELLNRKLVTKSAYDKFSALVIAKQASR